ncbi:hypothetical protein [Nevskia ramosa]|uniref:hypothetical protein n=1 Tax=Nevskia ramosa TaxID=64002 RepID=UPI00235268FC|nr:hypothetical protein [Nevskia ramosa]
MRILKDRAVKKFRTTPKNVVLLGITVADSALTWLAFAREAALLRAMLATIAKRGREPPFDASARSLSDCGAVRQGSDSAAIKGQNRGNGWRE